jgi:hypothetical protein
MRREFEMRSVLFAILMIAALAYVVWTREARAQYVGPANLYAFCDIELKEPCNTKALMLKDVCEDTIRTWTDGSARFSCAPVNAMTRDVYMSTVDRDVYERTIEAWVAGR